ncbi:hypothetical protein ACFL6I_14130 [candidate division KSB1 bacterium]
MSYQTEHKQKFADLKAALDVRNRDQLKLKANGGNTILFAYPPEDGAEYIQEARLLFPELYFIDVSILFVQFIDDFGLEDFIQYYKDFNTSTHLVFKSEDESIDLFDRIISKIGDAFKNQKIPVLVRIGVLNGTGIENIQIMDHKAVMEASLPLVVFYPSRIEDNKLLFLGFRPASNYRCSMIN